MVFMAGVAAVSLAPLASHLEAAAVTFVTGNVPVTGIQTWPGPLGDDFTVGSSPLTVTYFGVFDATQDPLSATITGYIYADGGASTLLKLTFNAGTLYPATDGTNPYVWQELSTSLTLAANTTYTLVAEGYGASQPNSNSNNSSTITFSNQGYALNESRYGAIPGQYPTLTPENSGYPGNWHFGDANIFYSYAGNGSPLETVTFIPEPATMVIWSLLGGAGLLGLRRARRRGNQAGWSEEKRVAIRRIVEQGCSKC